MVVTYFIGGTSFFASLFWNLHKKVYTTTCRHDPWGKLLIVITDTGEPVNILLADVVFAGEEPSGDEKMRASARLLKRTIDNIEYKRVEQENTLTFVVCGELGGKR